MISVVILTKNEEKNIVDCLESVSWVDEIIIVDDYSQDRTLEVIKGFNFKNKLSIFKKRLENDFSSQRNFALSKVRSDWILFLDADERVTKELREEINLKLVKDRTNPLSYGFFIPRKDVMWGKVIKHGEVGNIKLLRLIKKGYGTWNGKVHEAYATDKKTESLENYILHFPHQSINEFLHEINFYTSIRARELFNLKEKTSIFQIIFYPKAKFIVNYLFILGFKDGIEGLIIAILMSFHSFLVRGKLWILWQKE